jgi:lipopolysaccharide/colanic/teichoic acid biosynthesis glycosyltransferase
MLLPAEPNLKIALNGESGVQQGASERIGFGVLTASPPAATAGLPDYDWAEAARRVLNVTMAAVLLVLNFPLMFVIGVLVKLTSAGPVLYTQARVGVDRRNDRNGVPDGVRVVDYGGRLFRIYKFRTMHVRPEGAPQKWATRDDPRVTPIGRILRRYRLDELPQLFNVLMGDMNLVGPRPEQPRIFAVLREEIPNYEARQRVLPGITGLAQVSQAYDTSTDDVRRKVSFDLEYIERQSAIEDLKIMVRTLPAVVWRKTGW